MKIWGGAMTEQASNEVTRSALQEGASKNNPSTPIPSQRTSFDAPAEADWHRMISEAAYYLAAKRNFAPGRDLDDWLAAERAAKDFLSPH
jgi:hypothetical protein